MGLLIALAVVGWALFVLFLILGIQEESANQDATNYANLLYHLQTGRDVSPEVLGEAQVKFMRTHKNTADQSMTNDIGKSVKHHHAL